MSLKEEIEFTNQDYFEEYSKVVPLSLALIRALECNVISTIKIYRPCLDIGCGDGQFASILFKDQIDFGLDISEREIDLCKEKGKYKFLLLADSTKMPFKDNCFSTIISNSVFEHVDNIEKLLKEIQRVLKKDGTLIFTTHTNLYRKYLLFPDIFKRIKMERIGKAYIVLLNYLWKHTSIFSRRKWLNLLKENGFEVLESRYYMFKKTTRIFDLFLPFVAPQYFLKKITNKWRFIIPQKIRKIFKDKLNKYFLLEKSNSNNVYGACILLRVKKA